MQMYDKITGLIISNNKEISHALASEIGPVVEIADIIDCPSFSLERIMKHNPETVFIHMEGKTDEAFAIAGRLIKECPDIRVFIVAKDKDPDIIIQFLRLGIADYLVFPTEKKETLSVVRHAVDRSASVGKNGKIFTIFSPKGGQGVTSLAINLSDWVNRLSGGKTLLLDLNLYMGDVGIYLDTQPDYTPFDLKKDIERMDENLLFSSLKRRLDGFYLMTTPEEISDADQISGDDIKQMAQLLKNYFDYIIIDTPHDFSERTLSAFEAADSLLVIIQQGLPEIKSLQSALALLRELNQEKEKIKIIVNRYMKNSDLTAHDLSMILDLPVFFTISNNYRSFSQAINKGKTISSAFPKSGLNKQFKTMAGILTGIEIKNEKQSRWKKVFETLLD